MGWNDDDDATKRRSRGTFWFDMVVYIGLATWIGWMFLKCCGF